SADSVNSLPDGSTAISLPNLDKMHVYANQSKEKSSRDGREGFNDSELRYGGNLDAHKLLAIAYMCMIGAVDYRSVNGKLPSNWDEFVDTGFCPVTSEMINPATGRPFSGDGTPFSFEFRVHDNGSFNVGVHGDNDDYVKAW